MESVEWDIESEVSAVLATRTSAPPPARRHSAMQPKQLSRGSFAGCCLFLALITISATLLLLPCGDILFLYVRPLCAPTDLRLDGVLSWITPQSGFRLPLGVFDTGTISSGSLVVCSTRHRFQLLVPHAVPTYPGRLTIALLSASTGEDRTDALLAIPLQGGDLQREVAALGNATVWLYYAVTPDREARLLSAALLEVWETNRTVMIPGVQRDDCIDFAQLGTMCGDRGTLNGTRVDVIYFRGYTTVLM